MRPIVRFKRSRRIELLAKVFAKGDEEELEKFDNEILTSNYFTATEKRFIFKDSMSDVEMDLFDKLYYEYNKEFE